MATYVYVAAQDDNKVSIFTMDEASGALTLAGDQPVAGGPSLLAISPDRQTLYAGHREEPEISSYRIDQNTGELTQTGSVIPPGQPAFLSTDRTGRFLLSSYYADGKAAVHPLGEDGSVGSGAHVGGEHGGGRSRYADRPLQSVRLRALTLPGRTITCWNRPRIFRRPTSSTSSALTSPAAR